MILLTICAVRGLNVLVDNLVLLYVGQLFLKLIKLLLCFQELVFQSLEILSLNLLIYLGLVFNHFSSWCKMKSR